MTLNLAVCLCQCVSQSTLQDTYRPTYTHILVILKMCHNAASENEQIDKCIENGMPYKIIKTLKYTMRRRAVAANAVYNKNDDEGERQLTDTGSEYTEDLSENENVLLREKNNKTFPTKCPFGHGSITPIKNTVDSSLHLPQPLPNMYERLSSQSDKLDIYSAADTTNIVNVSGSFENTVPGEVYSDDILSKGTQFTRRLTLLMQQAIRCLQTSKSYT